MSKITDRVSDIKMRQKSIRPAAADHDLIRKRDLVDAIKIKRGVGIILSDIATSLTTGDGKGFFIVPDWMNGWNLVGVMAAVMGAQSTSGTPTYQVRNETDSVDMLSTALTIDANRWDSTTATTPAVIDTAHDDVATGDRIYIDKDTAGTGEKGDMVVLTFQLP